jgi:hypothetical protein
MIKIDYKTLHVEMIHQDDEVTIYSWSCNIGFGQLVIDSKTKEIIDDEYMSKEFCDKVIAMVEVVEYVIKILKNQRGD